jgi:glutathione synthase
MKFLFQMDDPRKFDINSDTTYLLIRETLKRKINCYYTHANDVHAVIIGKNNTIQARVSKIYLNKDNSLNYQKSSLTNLNQFNAIFVRQDPPYNMQYISNTYLLSELEKLCLIINNSLSLRNYPEKHIMMNFPSLTPPTIISLEVKSILDFINKYGTVILKPAYGNGGIGIKKIDKTQINLKQLITKYIKTFDSNPIVVQKFLPKYFRGDKRVILLGGNPIGAVLRVPAKNEIKSNFHAGGTAKKTLLTEKDKFICQSIKKFLIKNKLYFVGIDIIDGYLTEINITSPTGIHEINKMDNVQLEKKIINFFVKKIN